MIEYPARRVPVLTATTASAAGPGIDIGDLRLRVGAEPSDRDPCRQMVLCWTTKAEVTQPRVLLSTPRMSEPRVIPAATVAQFDPAAGIVRHLHRARLTRLMPGTRYTFVVMSADTVGLTGSFRVTDEHAACPAPLRPTLTARAA
ncbi:MAG: fibronectin type III domain-containing protein [Micromonosporaceae bacterium]|nr:fibronectin type III domain-containing protein [Micromonosporaceae bacterium]